MRVWKRRIIFWQKKMKYVYIWMDIVEFVSVFSHRWQWVDIIADYFFKKKKYIK